jgi:hypothetical protein
MPDASLGTVGTALQDARPGVLGSFPTFGAVPNSETSSESSAGRATDHSPSDVLDGCVGPSRARPGCLNTPTLCERSE